MNLTPKI